MTKAIKSEIVVVGAGAAGIHVAYLLAEHGFRVLLLDAQKKGEHGPTWVNGVPRHMAAYAGIEIDEKDCFTGQVDFINISPSGHQVVIKDRLTSDLDMRLFIKRLLHAFEKQKEAVFLPHTQVLQALFDGNKRLRSVCCFDQKTNTDFKITADLFIDASGNKGVLRSQIYDEHISWSAPAKNDLCTAAQEVYAIVDKQGADKYLQQHKAVAGQILAFLGAYGGFSVLRTHISADYNHISFLSGSRAGLGFPSGRQIIKDFIARHPFVGPKIFGGSRSIPLNRPFSNFVYPGLALLGDSACQVYSSHGSGIGVGLVAAQELAWVICNRKNDDIGSMKNLWEYNVNFHKRWGGLLASADLMRRFTQELLPEQIDWLFSSGLFNEKLSTQALDQLPSMLSMRRLPQQAKLLLSHPVGRKMGRSLLRIPLINFSAQAYPSFDQQWPRALENYDETMNLLVNAS